MKEVFHLFDENNEQYYWFLLNQDVLEKMLAHDENIEEFYELFETYEEFENFMDFMETGDNPDQFFNYPSDDYDFIGVHDINGMVKNNISLNGFSSYEIENFQKAIELWFEFFKSYNLVDENTEINISNDEDEIFKKVEENN